MNISIHPADYYVVAIYFIGIVSCGIWFGRHTKSTHEFFFSGQRFSWWLVSISCVATLIGSYSFIIYSEIGYNSGLSSSICYTNDWFILPFFLLVWLPIIYFSRVSSIPEYFARRFDEKTRMAALVIILIYLIGYIGQNLYTMGIAIRGISGINIYLCIIVVAIISLIYMYHGGQTSVIMADLIQGTILLSAGFLILGFGIAKLGGWEVFWDNLPSSHKLPFAGFNSPKEYHTVGNFWSDAIAGTIAFYCMNQAMLMRFMSTKSVREGKKTIAVVIFIMMPLAAIAVSSAGWLYKAMQSTNLAIDKNISPDNVFIGVSNFVCPPGFFGFVIGALLAALMSTVDALINAVSAIAVNDIWRAKIRPGREDAYYLKVARYFAVVATVLGILIVPIFAQFSSIFQGFSHFTSLVIPPMIVVIVMGSLWKRFTPVAAFITLVLGFAINLISIWVPQMVAPFAHGEAGPEYSYMRALFGLVVSSSIALTVTFFTTPKKEEEITGLTLSSIPNAQKAFKGSEPNEEGVGIYISGKLEVADVEGISLSQEDMKTLCAHEGDLMYVADHRPWLGGLRSVHVKAGKPHMDKGTIRMPLKTIENGDLLKNRMVKVEKIM